ncbi:hypothetical protein K435DRAFT_432513 [Dendrothele bispora CBS 962.96]|uniref:Uncharacterized protein n=1 Tax=Dendrothele bispora (strain CBS 962.96) TaxID=1314807 RepID=A0A4S8L3X5_DENBC|nr:hypothetical protein K435DRAFT_432513 [Dendrothele bispora CBS 962.96]
MSYTDSFFVCFLFLFVIRRFTLLVRGLLPLSLSLFLVFGVEKNSVILQCCPIVWSIGPAAVGGRTVPPPTTVNTGSDAQAEHKDNSGGDNLSLSPPSTPYDTTRALGIMSTFGRR